MVKFILKEADENSPIYKTGFIISPIKIKKELKMLSKKLSNELTQRVISVLSKERLSKCSKMQLGMMDQLMDQSLEEVENDPKQITNEMIVGIYEMVTEHLQPFDF